MKKKSPEPKAEIREPFFTRFLERQELTHVCAGKTLKYPSDNDEIPR